MSETAQQERILTPAQFRQALGDGVLQNGYRATAEHVDRAMARRDPAIAGANTSRYSISMDCAWHLYNVDKQRYKDVILGALGTWQSKSFWRRVAAQAAAFYRHGDWALLGRLAYRFDTAITQASAAQSGQKLKGAMHDALVIKRGWLALLDLNAGWLTIDAYLELALAYCNSLPENLPVPPSIVKFGAVDGAGAQAERPITSWPLLQFIWRKNRGTWLSQPTTLELLRKCSNPFVLILATQIERCGEATLKLESVGPFENDPFEELVGTEVFEPKLDPELDIDAQISAPDIQAPPIGAPPMDAPVGETIPIGDVGVPPAILRRRRRSGFWQWLLSLFTGRRGRK